MIVYHWIFAALWLVFILYWAISAVGVKRNVGGERIWWREIGMRLAVLVLVLLAVRSGAFSQVLPTVRPYAVSHDPRLGLVGVVFSAVGVGLAIWARAYLGRNWGMPMSRKENPELVTTGPYAVVRHPIYTGVLIAIFGSMIGQSLFWLLPLILAGIYFVYSARREEKLMMAEFPEQYPAYMKRTKMLLPFVL